MQQILKNLCELQRQAFIKRISFDTDLSVGQDSESIDVKLTYITNGSITRRYMFETTFTSNMTDDEKDNKLTSIQHFITTVTE